MNYFQNYVPFILTKYDVKVFSQSYNLKSIQVTWIILGILIGTSSAILWRSISLNLCFLELCTFYTLKITWCKVKVFSKSNNFKPVEDISMKLGIHIHWHHIYHTMKAHNSEFMFFGIVHLLYLENYMM